MKSRLPNNLRLAHSPQFKKWVEALDAEHRLAAIGLWTELPRNLSLCHEWARGQKSYCDKILRFCAFAAEAKSVEDLHEAFISGTPKSDRKRMYEMFGRILPPPSSKFARWLNELGPTDFMILFNQFAIDLPDSFEECVLFIEGRRTSATSLMAYCSIVLQAQTIGELEEAMLCLQPIN